jgi:hypothetical protein
MSVDGTYFAAGRSGVSARIADNFERHRRSWQYR